MTTDGRLADVARQCLQVLLACGWFVFARDAVDCGHLAHARHDAVDVLAQRVHAVLVELDAVQMRLLRAIQKPLRTKCDPHNLQPHIASLQ